MASTRPGPSRVLIALAATAVSLTISSCGGSGKASVEARASATFLLASGAKDLASSPAGSWSEGLDLDAFGLEPAALHYDLTSPEGSSIAFDVISRTAGNEGEVAIEIFHLESEGRPVSGGTSLEEAGLGVSGAGLARQGESLETSGDGFAQLGVQGLLSGEQILALRTTAAEGTTTALLRIRPGAASDITLAEGQLPLHPDTRDEITLYSSDSPYFGLPTLAVSGDRVSVVSYEGETQDYSGERYELRLQHEAASGAVTGSGSVEESVDSGYWRDHEIAALFNVLALVNTGVSKLTCRISFDRGASFAQTEVFASGESGTARLAQVGMALDYSLAILYWRSSAGGQSELVLVEGRPSRFENESPVAYEFASEVVVHREDRDVSPVIFDVDYSREGDLVVAFAFSRFDSGPDRTWISTTKDFVSVREFGGRFRTTLVDEERVIGRDPSVAVLGGGSEMVAYFAYEGREGMRLRVSRDGGRSFAAPLSFGDSSSHLPSVFARDRGDRVEVDVLYLTFAEEGLELRSRHWDDIARPREARDLTLTRAKRVWTEEPFGGQRVAEFWPGGDWPSAPIVTQVSWLGYDATLDGEDIVVVYDEETLRTPIYLPFLEDGGAVAAEAQAGAPGEFRIAEPPPLAPGLTEPVRAPDPEHAHQLKLLRLR